MNTAKFTESPGLPTLLPIHLTTHPLPFTATIHSSTKKGQPREELAFFEIVLVALGFRRALVDYAGVDVPSVFIADVLIFAGVNGTVGLRQRVRCRATFREEQPCALARIVRPDHESRVLHGGG